MRSDAPPIFGVAAGRPRPASAARRAAKFLGGALLAALLAWSAATALFARENAECARHDLQDRAE